MKTLSFFHLFAVCSKEVVSNTLPISAQVQLLGHGCMKEIKTIDYGKGVYEYCLAQLKRLWLLHESNTLVQHSLHTSLQSLIPKDMKICPYHILM